MGNIEVKNLEEDLKTTIKGECGDKKNFKEHLHTTFNKNFSGGDIT